MNKTNRFIGCVLIILSAFSSVRGDDADGGKDYKKIAQSNFLETEKSGIILTGYVDSGYSYNLKALI